MTDSERIRQLSKLVEEQTAITQTLIAKAAAMRAVIRALTAGKQNDVAFIQALADQQIGLESLLLNSETSDSMIETYRDDFSHLLPAQVLDEVQQYQQNKPLDPSSGQFLNPHR
ncbi:MAG: hypothetical protein GAK30_01356 [Paracidovorax wautersii]|uniref:Uncharacterized protein n=1 Tax=Paracidovorax wautersii TaxID=1177982 RepID=A0A7V8FQ75_9BURK|nr:MAG: hypothetical protein GAK30_01356 [Paracidovorax wautersii]